MYPREAFRSKQAELLQRSTRMDFGNQLVKEIVAHTGSLEKLLKHLKPMLRTNGKIILQASLANHLGIMFTRFVSSKWFTRKHGYNLNYYNLKTIEECVKSSGLRISSCKRHRFGLPFGDKISKLGNLWLEVLLERFSAKHGSEAIIIITHQG